MVSSDKSFDRNVSPDKSHQRLSSHSEITVSKETNDNKINSSKPVEPRSIPSVVAKKEVEDSDATVNALQSDQEGSACTSPIEKPLQSPNTTRLALQSHQDSPSVIHEKVLKDVAEKEMQDSDASADALQSDKEGSSCSLPHEKPLQKPNPVLHALQSVQDRPSIIREKVSKDGYNWRKYGQKHVKGNIRSYYKCTHPNCQAKKQLEQSNNGQVTDTIYIGQHNHPQVNTPVPVDSVVTVVKERPDKPSLVSVEDKTSIEHGCVPQQVKLNPLEALPILTVSTRDEVKAALLQSTRTRNVILTNEDPESKRLKKNNSNAHVTGVEKSTSEITVSKETSDNKIDSSKPVEPRSISSVVAEKEMLDSDATVDALQLDREGSACTSPHEKPLQSPNTTRLALKSRQDSPSIIHEKVLKDVAEKEMQDSDATADALQSDKKGSACSLPHEKPLQKPNSVPHALQSVQDSPSIIPEKVSKDGYNWRKYGQKHVKGNIRSYYKCTYPNCLAKKQLEQSNNGQITDTIYISQHNHPLVNTPVPVDSGMTVVKERPDKPSLVSVEDKTSIEHGCMSQQVKLKPLEALPILTVSTKNEVKAALLQSTRTRNVVLTNEDLESKRLKKNNSNAHVTGVEKSTSEITVSKETNDNKIDSSKPVEPRSIPSVVAEKEVEDSDATVDALQSDQEDSACTSPLEKPLQSPNTTRLALKSRQDSPSIIHEKVLKDVAEKEMQDSDATADALLSDKEGSVCSLPHEKPNSVPHVLQSAQDSPSIIREKVSKDGYNWRKYGQKHVKGNIRSYYKCTNPNCQAKKQLEQSNNGQITDTIYIGQHNHPQVNTPVPVDHGMTVVKERPDKLSLVSVEDKASIEHGCVSQQVKLKPLEALPNFTVSTKNEVKAALLQSTRTRNVVFTNEDPESKRLKINNSNAHVTWVEKSTSDSRVIVQTSSDVDFVNGGYRWRKYGQKLVKGNSNPRSYYRCSNPGCPVKKHVERASHDQKIVITTYEGHHDHESPSRRIVTHNEAANTPTTNISVDSGSKSRGNSACFHTAESNCLDSERKSTEQSNNESISKSKSCDMVESTSNNKEQNGNSHTEKDSVNLDTVCHSGSELPCRLNEQKKDEVRTISEEESKDESKLNKQS